MLVVLSFFISLFLVTLSIPPIINLVFRHDAFDANPERRKIHKGKVPRFGGVAIYLAVWFPVLLICDSSIVNFPLFLACSLVFALGFVDDLHSLDPGIKFLFQFVSAFLIVLSDIRITSLHGILQLGELNDVAAASLSVLFVVAIMNAYNLIDGIDGLAGSLALMVFLVYAYFFYQAHLFSLSWLASSLSGAMTGFLFFNVTSRRKIFMGDCGSLFIGLTIAILSIKMMGFIGGTLHHNVLDVHNTGIVVALLSIPVFDTMRVFILRLLKKGSPFKGDGNHVHHRLLSLGLRQLEATSLLLLLNIVIVAFAIFQHEFGNIKLIIFIMLFLVGLNTALTILLKYKSWRSS
jgi:UDP-GlcNAc:undecaprenyl-phosphate GlcNAc-1-phosphate transferase